MSKKKKDKELIDTEAKEETAKEAVDTEVKNEKTSEDAASETKEAAEDEIAPEDVTYDADGNVIVKKKRRRKRQRKPSEVNIVKELLGLIVYIGVVVLVCFLIITFIGCRSQVDGNSMNPTLNDKDNLWVNKLAYKIGEPKRFDIIIFNYSEDVTYVKRIIGLPGETVMIDKEGNIYIDNELLQENYGKERIIDAGRAASPVILAHDEYFVLGDNRNGSSDSRWSDVGNVKKDQIIGKVVLRIFPFKSFGPVH